MEEKIIISGKGSIRNLVRIIAIILLVIGIIGNIQSIAQYESQGYYDALGHVYVAMANYGTIGAPIVFVISFFIPLTELTVTDKRIYGKANFGKRVDLPLDSVSAVGTGMLGRFTVATASGQITFVGLSNKEEFQEKVSELLIKRNRNTVEEIPKSTDGIEELKKLKELLDMGIVTQEEFENKKKQILLWYEKVIPMLQKYATNGMKMPYHLKKAV